MPAQTKRKTNRRNRINRIIALSLAVVLLGSVLLAAAVSNFF